LKRCGTEKIKSFDKVIFENKKKRENMEIKDVVTRSGNPCQDCVGTYAAYSQRNVKFIVFLFASLPRYS